MSWANWFCPKEAPESPRTRKRQEEQEEKEKLTEEGFLVSNGEYWKIDKQKYEQENWGIRLSKGSKAKVRYLLLEYCQQPRILQQLTHVEFLQLRSLYLAGNRIVSVEAIVHLQAPQLRNLDLRNNLITQIKSLRKAGPCFDHLLLAGNCIYDYSALPEIHFYKRLQTSYVSNFAGSDRAFIPDLGPFIKAEARYVMDHLFIHQMDTLESVARKQALFDK